MPQVVRIIGGAGTGKTTRLLELMGKAIDAGDYSPFDIAFVSFTRAARQEAAERAAAKFRVSAEELQQQGWFRTLHSACFRLLEARKDNLLTDTAKDRKWIEEHIEEEVSGIEDESNPFAGKTSADRVLSMWSTARNKLCSFEQVHEVCAHCDSRTPALDFCEKVITRYEQAKRLDGRYDFVDLVARYAGKSFTFNGPRDTQREGLTPEIPVWFLDEQQDTSALLDLVCKRLTSRARWVYMVLDPMQSIYGWSGASAKHAMNWDVAKQQVLDQSFRCPAEISELGEQCLQRCSDYWDRGIRPANHHGAIEDVSYETPWSEMINPEESWLLLGRTNFLAQRLSKRIEPLHIPWHPLNGGNNKWKAPVRIKAIQALISLRIGGGIGIDDWQAVLKEVSGREYFERGTKKRFAEFQGDKSERKDLETLKDWGATDEFLRVVKNDKRWQMLVKDTREYYGAFERWGPFLIDNTQVRIGTIHSAKGMEADNVAILLTSSQQVNKGREFQEIADEEYRLAYVAVTRARKRLLILKERNAPYEMDIPR